MIAGAVAIGPGLIMSQTAEDEQIVFEWRERFERRDWWSLCPGKAETKFLLATPHSARSRVGTKP